MTRWEYDFQTVQPDNFCAVIRERGEEGWLLAATTPGSVTFHLTFVRQIDPKPSRETAHACMWSTLRAFFLRPDVNQYSAVQAMDAIEAAELRGRDAD